MSDNNFSNQTHNETSAFLDSLNAESSALQTFFISLKLIISIGGIIGNLLVCILIQQVKTQEIKFLIVSQTVIDLFTSIVMLCDVCYHDLRQFYSPPIGQPVAGYLYCSFWKGQILLFGLFAASTYNLVAISIERYIAVFHPFWYRIHFTKMKTYLLGIIAWTVAPVGQMVFGFIGHRYDHIEGKCGWHSPSKIGSRIIGVYLFLWEFFIPCVIMGVCFARISIKLRKYDTSKASLNESIRKEMTTVSGSCANARNDHQTKAVSTFKSDDSAKQTALESSRSRKVTKTFVFVFLAYVCCWSTNQILFLQYNLGGYSHYGRPESYFANGMAILNSTINPFIYVLHVKNYRKRIKELVGI